MDSSATATASATVPSPSVTAALSIPEVQPLHASLRGRVYAITGGTSGIGLSTARLLLAAGAAVSICGRTPAKVDAAKRELVELYRGLPAGSTYASFASSFPTSPSSAVAVATAAEAEKGDQPASADESLPLPSPPLSVTSAAGGSDDGEASAPVLSLSVDVARAPEVDAWIGATVARFGRLDGAVNAAALECPRMVPLAELDDGAWAAVLGANLTGVMNAMRAQVRAMLARVEAAEREGRPLGEEGGVIVNVASILASVGLPLNAAYVAAKHGVLGLTKSVAREYGPRGIRVNAMSP